MVIKKKLSYWLLKLRGQAFHIIFISSLVALTLLVTWWALLLYNSVDQIYETKIESLQNSVYSNSLFIGHNSVIKPEVDQYKHDKNLEIIRSEKQPTTFAIQLLPFWKHFWLQPREEVLKTFKDKNRRQHLMIVGESSLLLLLILVSGLMIYRMYWLEKRTTRELHELWSRVSHEIKTPITGLKAFLETLSNHHIKRKDLEPLIKLALRQVEKQQQLSENMLVGQKLKNKGSGINIENINLDKFIKGYINKHSISLSGLKINYNFKDLDDKVALISADPEALRIILDNILDNSRKYGGNEVKMEIGLIDLKSISVFIRDNGPGFDPAQEENIFKAYKRLNNDFPNNRKKGTGMGLYISRQLAKKMGGDLTAHSYNEEKGANFILTLKKNRKGS